MTVAALAVVPPLAAAAPRVAALAEKLMAGNAARTAMVKVLPGLVRSSAPSDKREDLFLQQFASARETLFDRVLGQFEILGDGFDGLMFAIKEDKGFPVDLRNALQRTPEDGLLLVIDRLVEGQRFGRGGFGNGVEGFGGVARFAALFFQAIVGVITGDLAKPGAELVRFAQTVELLPSRDESVLGDVFALAQAASIAVSEGADKRLITGDDLAEGIAIAGEALGDEGGIADLHGAHGSQICHVAK